MPRKLSPERKESFMNAALKLFAQNGIQHTSTAAIAKEAGSAAGTLFIYFPTKQDLINELVLQISREQSAQIKAQLSPTLSVCDTFFTIWLNSIRWFMGNMDAFSYIQQVREPGLLPDEVVQKTETDLDYYFVAIQKGQAQQRIKPYPLELIGTFLYQDIVAALNLIRVQPDPAQQERIIQTGFQIFWDGIKAEQPPK